jgi:5-deoxy-glucuronate isomerase
VAVYSAGCHPVGVYGYDLYDPDMRAGPKRTWRFHNDPAHAWLVK